MIRAYQYVFYRACVWQVRAWKTKAGADVSAVMLTTMLLFCNAVTLLALIEALLRRPLWSPPLSKTQVLVAAAGIFLLQYVILVFSRTYERIVDRFSGESPRQRFVRGIAVV